MCVHMCECVCVRECVKGGGPCVHPGSMQVGVLGSDGVQPGGVVGTHTNTHTPTWCKLTCTCVCIHMVLEVCAGGVRWWNAWRWWLCWVQRSCEVGATLMWVQCACEVMVAERAAMMAVWVSSGRWRSMRP